MSAEYTRGHLGSKPKFTVDLVSKRIANTLEFVNAHPEMTQKQMEMLDRKIKTLYQSMESAYLVDRIKSTTPSRKKKTVKFSPGTKSRGGKTKRRRRH